MELCFKLDVKIVRKGQEEFNGMITLPIVIELSMFPKIRQSFAMLHNLTDFDKVIEAQIKSGTQIFSQFCIIGNWLYHYERDSISFRIVETDEPVLRWGDHLPYNPPLWSGDG